MTKIKNTKAKKVTPKMDTQTKKEHPLADLHEQYEEVVGKEVPNNMKSNEEWLQAKIDEKLWLQEEVEEVINQSEEQEPEENEGDATPEEDKSFEDKIAQGIEQSYNEMFLKISKVVSKLVQSHVSLKYPHGSGRNKFFFPIAVISGQQRTYYIEYVNSQMILWCRAINLQIDIYNIKEEDVEELFIFVNHVI